jgi:hypothetical protein
VRCPGREKTGSKFSPAAAHSGVPASARATPRNPVSTKTQTARPNRPTPPEPIAPLSHPDPNSPRAAYYRQWPNYKREMIASRGECGRLESRWDFGRRPEAGDWRRQPTTVFGMGWRRPLFLRVVDAATGRLNFPPASSLQPRSSRLTYNSDAHTRGDVARRPAYAATRQPHRGIDRSFPVRCATTGVDKQLPEVVNIFETLAF